jgi:uncharacterized protein (TIGR00266 family)
MKSHEIDHKIYGDDIQFVEIILDPGETVLAEAGAMMYMEDGILMETVFGDGSNQSSTMMDKLFGAGKRMIMGESLFMTAFTNNSNTIKNIAFGAPYPGKIIPVDLRNYGNKLICQKDSYLCSAKGISIDIAFQKRLGTGLFGGEGFIMEKLTGDGMAFIHAGGTIVEKELKLGEVIRIDTGCIVAYTGDVDFNIEYVGNIKSAIFGGEGLFFATLRGPGKVFLQSLPLSRLAQRLVSAAPQSGNPRRGEGSVLDVLGGLGNLLDGK